MAGKKNPNLGDKLRQEREGAENTLRDSRNKATDSSTGDSSKKKAVACVKWESVRLLQIIRM